MGGSSGDDGRGGRGGYGRGSYIGASEGPGLVGTPGVTTDRIIGRGHISLVLEVLEQLFFFTVLPSLFCNLQVLITHGFFVSVYVIVTISVVPMKNHHFC